MQIQAGFASDRGRRGDNQDFAGVVLGDAVQQARHGVIAGLADGVGGHRGGRVAAELAIRSVIDGYLCQPHTLGIRHALARAMEAANRWIVGQGRSSEDLAGMATTCTMLVLRHRALHILHVGDSRAYCLREGRLERLTTDHVPNQPDQRHMLTRGIGLDDALRLDYGTRGIRLQDRFLLCSDGVHGVLNDAKLTGLLDRGQPADQTAALVVRAAFAAGSQDNITAIILDVLGLPSADPFELAETAKQLPLLDLPKAGQVVDGYGIERELASGRYTKLFIAKDGKSAEPVVLKFPKPVISEAVEFQQAFLREMWVAGNVRSPYLGSVIDIGARQSGLYLAMPYYPGETLEARLKIAPPLRLAAAIEIATKLARAVTSLHAAGIIHRDIKPDNILLEPAGGLKLIDFGVVRLPELEAADRPGEATPGTPSYMAPEMFGSEANGGDARTDVFALGVTLFRLFARGAYPYGEIEPFTRPRFRRAASLARFDPELPSWLVEVADKAVAVPPEARFQTALDLALAFEHGASHLERQRARRFMPLYQRNPVRVWQILSLVLLILLLATLHRG